MKWFCLCVIFCLLVACNVPSPDFRMVPATRVTVEGSVFDVRLRANLAEAMRVNPQDAPRFGVIEQRAAFAMQQVSGCKVVSVSGDQALAFGRLDCGAGAPPPRSVSQDVICVRVRGSEVREIGQVRVELDCDLE